MTNRKKIRGILLLIPSAVGVCLFWVIPFVWNLVYMFTAGSFVDNIRYLFSNDYFLLAIKNTGLFTGIAAPAAVFIALTFGILTLRFAVKISFLQKAFFLPVVLPSAVFVIVWQLIFANAPPFQSLIFVYIWKYSGIYFILILTALASIDPAILDAAVIDGANYAKIVLNIIIPCIIPTLFFTFILSVSNAFKIFRESYLLYGEYPETEVYMLQNFLNNHFVKLNYNYISTASVVVSTVVYLFVLLIYIAERRWSKQIW